MISQVHRSAAAGSRILGRLHPRICLKNLNVCSWLRDGGLIGDCLAAVGTFSRSRKAISPWPGRRADWHLWIMDASGDALFPRRYLEEFEKRIAELHGCVERARERVAEAVRQDVGLLLDAADAHEQAAMAYELAGGNGHARDFQARAIRHRQVAAARRATAASLASGVPDRCDSDDPRPQALIPDGDPPGVPGDPDVGMGHLGVSCGNCREQQRDTRSHELPHDITYRVVGPWQAVLLLAIFAQHRWIMAPE